MKHYWKKLYAGLSWAFYKLLLVVLNLLPMKLYQPLYASPKAYTTRDCHDRWTAIEPHLPQGPGSLLDIGCNLGFFTFKASEKEIMAFGVDADPFYLMTCNAIKTTEKIDHIFFLKGMIDKKYLEQMPSYDTVFNFSVFHHWVKAYGAEEAQEMMRILAGKCNTIFFETGQPDEAGTKWAEKLSFMGDDPKSWIAQFLKEIGFKNVEVIGTFSTGLTAVDRYLYCGKK
ncbi:MAG: DUF1698 domain-containing protein [Rhodospirillales bacterium]|nr:DUF1698 domain-containing protein [Rhodospirillales bacterium]MCB9995389.1 DUF1698 domain-containing protein [Rhodospirillales bacterium]